GAGGTAPGGARARDHGRGDHRTLSVHPVLVDRRRLTMYVAAAAPLALAGFGLLAQGRNALPLAAAALIAFPLSFAGTLLLLPVWYACRSLPVYETSATRLLATHLAGAGLMGVVAGYLGRELARLFDAPRPGGDIAIAYQARSAGVLAAGALVY